MSGSAATDATLHPRVDVVIPTIGRPSLSLLLDSLLRGGASGIDHVIVVDDRPAPGDSTELIAPWDGELRVGVVHGGGRGPAAARNAGWRRSRATWIAFLDDDVVLPDGWTSRLLTDIAACGADVAACQGRIRVPLPVTRRPTDWERNVAGLERAQWATADMAVRRSALIDIGGFDERFARAYREDSDLGLRLTACGYRVVLGERSVLHPVGPAPWHVSIAKQAGNGDDALMRRLHGPQWRTRAGAPRGRLRRHSAMTLAGVGAIAARATGHRRLARAASLVWCAGWVELTVRRVVPGPRTLREIATMAVTSSVLPIAAPIAWTRGRWSTRHETIKPRRPPIDAVLFDRDGTLVVDVPYNGDPSAVRPMPGARAALDRLRHDGVAVGVVTNQSGIGRSLLTIRDVDAVNAHIEAMLGPFDVWAVCPHVPEDGCGCRKPAPGLVHRATQELGVDPARCVVIGDIGGDIAAAGAAGARGVLVPTAATRAEEIASAPVVARDLTEAVDIVFGTSTLARRQ